MAKCEFSGEETNTLIKVRVAGSVLQVSPKYAHLGPRVDVEPKSTPSVSFKKRQAKQELSLEVISGYNKVIQSAVQKKGLQLQQVARAVNIKESTLHKYILGKVKPDIDAARKLERFLSISLLEEEQEVNPDDFMTTESDSDTKTPSGGSLGDLLQEALAKQNK